MSAKNLIQTDDGREPWTEILMQPACDQPSEIRVAIGDVSSDDEFDDEVSPSWDAATEAAAAEGE